MLRIIINFSGHQSFIILSFYYHFIILALMLLKLNCTHCPVYPASCTNIRLTVLCTPQVVQISPFMYMCQTGCALLQMYACPLCSCHRLPAVRPQCTIHVQPNISTLQAQLDCASHNLPPWYSSHPYLKLYPFTSLRNQKQIQWEHDHH